MPTIQKNNAVATTAIQNGSAWTGGTPPGLADEGTWISTSTTGTLTQTADWTVGKLSLGANVSGDVAIGNSTNRITLRGISGVMIDQSANSLNRVLSFNGPITFGTGTDNVSIVGSNAANTNFIVAITKTAGDVAYSSSGNGSGVIFFGADSSSSGSNTWTGGSFTLNSGTLWIGNGSGDSTVLGSGVLGVNTNTLIIGSNNPIISTNNTGVNRAINNGVTIGGSFTVGNSSGAGVIRLLGTITVSSGAWTVTVPGTGGGATFTYAGAQAPIQGTGDLTKAGAGLLTLGTSGGANGTWTGKWLSSAGTTTVTNPNYFANAILDSASIGVTWPASARIGGVTGSTSYAFPTTLSFGPSSLVGSSVDANWTGGFLSNVTLSKLNPGVQRLGGNSSGRTTAGTTITRGAIQLDDARGLYAAGSSNTTTVGSGGALWLNGVTTNAGSLATISGNGVALNGALRNVSGNSTHSATITLGASARIYNDIASTTLTLKNITWGANTLTLDTGATSTATILLDGTSSSSSTNAQMVVSGTGITKAPRATSIPTTNRVTVTVDTNARLQFTSTAAVVATVNTLKSNAGGNARIIIGT